MRRKISNDETFKYEYIITGRNEVLAKVIFLQACVCPRGGGGGSGPGGVVSNFWGVSNFSGGSPIFWGGLQPEYGQRSAGMHPTGMHSCFYINSVCLCLFLYASQQSLI